METIRQILIESVSGTGWTFIAYLILVGMVTMGIVSVLQMLFQTTVNIHNRFWRHWNIRKHGYPPSHCDADGDFKQRENE